MLYPRDNYNVRHEFADIDTLWRQLYMGWTAPEWHPRQITQQEYYMRIAREIDLTALARVVLGFAPMGRLNLHKTDLNGIPLREWDARHYAVTQLAHAHGWRVWTLSDSVCVLKTVARWLVFDEGE
jgi:hypothetical protein